MSVKKAERRAKRKPAPRIYIRPDPAELETLLALTRQELAAYKSRFLATVEARPSWKEERAELVRQLDELRAAYDALLAGAAEAPKVLGLPPPSIYPRGSAIGLPDVVADDGYSTRPIGGGT